MKRKKLYIAILLLAGVLTSCKVGKSYVRPDLHLPDSLERSQDSVSFGDQDWRDIYTDATLRSLIERALDHNKDMLIAAARVKEMAAQKRISTAALLPDIKGKVTGERELENHGGDAFKRSDTFEAQFLVSWEVDLWGNLRWARSASIAEYLQSIEAQRALQMTIVAEVAQAYYELVALDTELDIVKQTLKAREEGVRLARIRFAGGLTSETSYRQAQVELARTATLVPDLERKISLKENDIAYLAKKEFSSVIVQQGFGGEDFTRDEPLTFAKEGALQPNKIAHFDELNTWTQSGTERMVRKDDWKLVLDNYGRGELYNLKADPSEINNLYNKKKYASKQMELLEELMTWELRVQDPLPVPRNRYHFKRNPYNYHFEDKKK